MSTARADGMSSAFESIDLALQSPCSIAELLDAAGIDGSLPHSWMDDPCGGLDRWPDEESAGH